MKIDAIRCIFVLGFYVQCKGNTLDGCPPLDPNCHPSCIVYATDHCRYCSCANEGGYSGGSSSGSFSSGMSADASWEKGSSRGDWSSEMNGDKSSWNSESSGGKYSYSGSDDFSNFGSSSYSDSGSTSGSTIQYVFVETEKEPSYSRGSDFIPNPFQRGHISPFSRPSAPISPSILSPGSAVMPGSNSAFGQAPYSASQPVHHVPLVAPGMPKYCVRCHIPGCPATCERIDEYGCRSCPCAPSRFQSMPVDCGNHPPPEQRKSECLVMKLCMQSCSDGFRLGRKDSDGCHECMCVRKVQTTPRPEGKSCPATLSCMLKCKEGYILGEKQHDGCPSCKCLSKNAGGSTVPGSSSYGNGFTGKGSGGSGSGSSWSGSGSSGSGSGSSWSGNGSSGSGSGSSWSGSGSSSNSNGNTVASNNGVGNGKCKPPMCLDGHMPVDAAMQIGKDSAGGSLTSGSGSGMTSNGVMNGGSTAGSGNCYPMCENGQSTDISGSGNSAGSGSGCSGPFCATMSGGGMGGGGGGMTAGGGSSSMGMDGGGNGKPFSPFSSAMSGGGPGMGMSGGGPGMGMAGGGPGMGMAGGRREGGAAMGVGGSSAGGATMGVGGPSAEHRECPGLVHCLVTCDGRYLLGDLDSDGCQTCSCN